jgi:hypothetical protein
MSVIFGMIDFPCLRKSLDGLADNQKIIMTAIIILRFAPERIARSDFAMRKDLNAGGRKGKRAKSARKRLFQRLTIAVYDLSRHLTLRRKRHIVTRGFRLAGPIRAVWLASWICCPTFLVNFRADYLIGT